ncbi:hypothetical protein [Inediibacterium massiliense]|uniref:hypothetical protein n=1 Tax=Inediibacterium massiliense TaxID=1658111 RepID=UPI0006B57C15|nr:hypothetical protein [Inediibacterium massiliense]
MADMRGEVGGKVLKRLAKSKVRNNKISLQKALKKFRDNKIPLIKTELSKLAGISVATLNRSPYKEMIKEYLDEEKVLLSPCGKQEVARLIQENNKLKEEIKEWKGKYNRLKKEIHYSKELFG